MSEHSPEQKNEEHLSGAYQRMLERVRATLDRAEHETLPHIQARIAEAKEHAVELGELTREEAERVAAYLRRDLADAARYMSETNKEFRDWLRFDMELIEERLLGMFSLMVDQTRLELDRWERQAREAGQLHTGEMTAMGTLRCASCGQEMHFHGPARIPPCPKCHGTRFSRATR